MHMSTRSQVIWWGAAAAVLFLSLWLLGQAILPFIIGAGVAYLLDPLADRLERAGLSRTLAVVVITLAAIVAFVTFILFLAPMVIRQTTQLINAAPEMILQLQAYLQQRFPGLLPQGGTLQAGLDNLSSLIGEKGGEILGSVLGSVAGVVGVIALLVIVPVVAFYLLLDWDDLVERVDVLLPRQHAPTIRRLAGEIDETLSGFLRGQGTVILILGTFYSLGLMAVGLPYGMAIGIGAAVLSFIPYVGVLIGGATALGVALFHFWGEPLWIGLVFGIFALGQVVEGNYLQPKIVGNHVGLHPVWLLLALSVFGALFGFVGMMVAVPLAASLGVLVRFAAQRYVESPLYTGQQSAPPPPPPMLVEIAPEGTRERVLSQRLNEAGSGDAGGIR
ncbi:AI-2E family transporter [Paracoccus aerodenitrificans]|uniref:AI-2E family transporter n=1 Tax=Paracoccus aerodenitrificans TaxID=3017781 RepID=UPI0022F014CB|nr:AI-2E family transporter [Paracoccus aerodenitrificans]WBU63116.1 AI-2E family transporter [Paracoccus aerodenitrificans]